MWPVGYSLMLTDYAQMFKQQQQLIQLFLEQGPSCLNQLASMQQLQDLPTQKLIESTQHTPLHPPLKESKKNQKKLRQQDDLKNRKKSQCWNKFCDKTTEECSQVKIEDKIYTLCVLCYQNYKDDYYCEYCLQIFDPMDEEEIDEKEWIQCESCERWNHIDCEQIYGINNIKKVKRNTNYYCKKCRQKPTEQRITQKQVVPRQKEQPSVSVPSSLKLQPFSLKLSDAEIIEDLEELRQLIAYSSIEDNQLKNYRKTTRRKKVKQF